MSAFAHCEDGHVWRPRHPVVCIIDTVGLVVMIGLVAVYKPPLATAALPVAIALQYGASILHHWMPFARWRSLLDRGVIFAVIGATYLPYWGNLLPAEEAAVRLSLVGMAAVAGLVLLLAGASEKLIGVYWAVFASAGLVISFNEFQVWMSPAVLAAFWIGSVLYGVQQAVYSLRYPNPIPEVFGYREVQHVVLLAATTIGSLVAIRCT